MGAQTIYKIKEGDRYGRLTVVRFSHREHKQCKWLCRCDCGNEVIVAQTKLGTGHTKSCGCLKADRTRESHLVHGMTGTRLHNLWLGIQRRCYNPHDRNYPRYGGRGIVMCDEWLHDFMKFHDWAMSHGYDPDAPRGACTVDRIDVNGEYSPDNCRIIPLAEQMLNKRNTVMLEYNGVEKPLRTWCAEFGVNPGSCYTRYRKHTYTPEEILFGKEK